MWIETVEIAIESGLRLGGTQCRHMKFTGPCSEKSFYMNNKHLTAFFLIKKSDQLKNI